MRSPRTALLLTLAGTVGLHLLAERELLPATPAVTFWLHRAYAYSLVLAFALLQVGVGWALLRLPWLRDCPMRRLERWLYGFALGTCATSAALLALAVGGWLTPPGLLALLVVGVVVALVEGREQDRQLPGVSSRALPAPLCPTRLPVAASAAIAVWSIPYLIQTLLPNHDYDGAMYHLPLAQRFLTANIWATDPYFLHLNFPGAWNLLYCPFLAAGAEEAVIPFNFLLGGVLLASCFALADRYWGRTAAWWAVLIGAATNVAWEMALTPRIDTSLAPYLVLAVLALLRWDANRARRGWLLIVGALLGLTVGAKYTSAAFPMVLLPLAGLLAVRDLRRQLPALVGAAVLVVVPAGFWYLRNAVQLGDPMYPLLLKAPLHAAADGTLVRLDAELAATLDRRPLADEETADALRDTPLAFVLDLTPGDAALQPILLDWCDVLRHPARYSRHEFDWISGFVLLGFLLPLVARDRPALLLYAIAVALWLLVGSQVHLSRYLIPVFGLYFVAAAVVVTAAVRRLGRVATVPLFALLAGELGVCTSVQWTKLFRVEPGRLLRGEESEIDFVCRCGYCREPGYAPAVRFLNEHHAAHPDDRDGSVLILGLAPTHLLRYPSRQSLADHDWLGFLLRAGGDPAQLHDVLRAEGVRFLLVSPHCYEWEARHQRRLTPAELRQMRWACAHLMNFVRDHGTVIYRSQYAFVARINDAATGPTHWPAER
jgi:hypothetical protein